MKKLLVFGAILSLLFSSCHHEIYPYAEFYADNIYVEPGDVVSFINISEDAIAFYWDFGDGYGSSVISPTHSYIDEGVYTVTLEAESKDGHIDRTSITIEVYYTELEITVAEWNYDYIIDYIVPDALVILYPTYDDWLNDTRSVVDGYTDANGMINFWGLQSGRRYYVYVQADYYDNYDVGLDDPSLVTTPVLTRARITNFIAWADYFGPLKRAKEPRKKNIQRPKVKRSPSSSSNVDVSE